MSKILILSIPYNGATQFAEGIAIDLGYKFFDNPLNHTTPRTWVNDVGFEYTVPRGHTHHNGEYLAEGYDYPDDVPNNTIITHFVNWWNLPSSLSEDSFLTDFRSKFDHTILIRGNNIEYNWKNHLASINQTSPIVNNWMYEKWLHQDQNYEYQDSYYDETIKTKYETAHAYLCQYIIDNPSIPAINIDSELFDIEWEIDTIKSKFNGFGISGFFDQSTHDEVMEQNKNTWSYCMANKDWHIRW